MRTTTKAGIKATYYDENVWKQERLLISIEKTTGSTATKVSLFYLAHSLGTYGSPFVTYDLDSKGKAVIDVTDLVRTYAVTNITEYIYIYSDLAASLSDAIFISTKVIGLISPFDMFIPYQQAINLHLLVAPPQKMLTTLYASNPLMIEFFQDVSYTRTMEQYIGSTLNTSATISSNGSVTLASSTITSIILKRSSVATYTYPILPLQCDRQYALVEWVSITGQTRRHTFGVRKVQTASADSYALLTDDNSYNDIKGRTDSFVLYLDGLTPYDYWYYSDLVTSSKVLVSLNEKNADFRQVQVVTKSVTQPDGNAFDGKLEIQVNWKRYDAVAM